MLLLDFCSSGRVLGLTWEGHMRAAELTVLQERGKVAEVLVTLLASQENIQLVETCAAQGAGQEVTGGGIWVRWWRQLALKTLRAPFGGIYVGFLEMAVHRDAFVEEFLVKDLDRVGHLVGNKLRGLEGFTAILRVPLVVEEGRGGHGSFLFKAVAWRAAGGEGGRGAAAVEIGGGGRERRLLWGWG